METLPLSVFEEIGKYLDPKDFLTLLSLSKKIKSLALLSNIKIKLPESCKGLELFSSEYVKPENKFYQTYWSHFINVKVVITSHHSLTNFFKFRANFNNIQHLELRCYNITDQTLKGLLNNMVNLETLELCKCNKITDNAAIYIATELDKLVFLDLSETGITDDGIAHLACKVKLQTLKLSKCKITDKSFRELAKLVNLCSLDISGCELITNSGVNELAGLVKLKSLSVSGKYDLSKLDHIEDIIVIAQNYNFFRMPYSFYNQI